MRNYACGLETTIRLSEEQILKLEKESICGILNFREPLSTGQNERLMPFELNVIFSQRENVKVDVIPDKTYFGDADKIFFFINEEYYLELKETGKAEEARFFFGVGKLELYLEKVKY